MSTEELKLQIFRQVDSLDCSKLKEFYGVMLNYLNSNKDTAEWIGVSDVEKHGIDEAVKEMTKNKGIANEQVMAMMKNKYIQA
jgi:hypothetical protein